MKANGNAESFKAQVAGAFYRKELGDIDLVWGDSSFGLRHILEKHGAEFENLAKNISEAIEKGEVVSKNNVDTIWHKVGNDYYKVGLSKGFYGKGDNKWVITGYKVDRERDKTFGDVLFTDKRPLSNSKGDIITKNSN